jgi:ribosomal protein S12 methylthiotransferase
MSLSCPKALVDSERINGRLRAEGYELGKVHRDAAAVIVNTCGFLFDNAKTETLVASARLGSLSSIEPRSA